VMLGGTADSARCLALHCGVARVRSERSRFLAAHRDPEEADDGSVEADHVAMHRVPG
jgi:hypothetical protein